MAGKAQWPFHMVTHIDLILDGPTTITERPE
jgi:hypothetical protein